VINTPSKRRAAAGWAFFPVLPIPDGTVDSGDRRSCAGCYGPLPIAGGMNDAPKRRAAAGWLFWPVLPIPNARIDRADRAQLTGCYRAISVLPIPRTSALRNASGDRTSATTRISDDTRVSA
jgi:hypothetical protein